MTVTSRGSEPDGPRPDPTVPRPNLTVSGPNLTVPGPNLTVPGPAEVGLRPDTAGLEPDRAGLGPGAVGSRPDRAGLGSGAAELRPDTAGLGPDAARLRPDTARLRPDAAGLGRGRGAQSRPRLQALISGPAASRITTVVRTRTTAVLGGVPDALHREARRRPALSTAFGVVALGLVVVSVAAPGAAAPEFRSPPAAVMAAPSIQVSAAAVYTGLAPYEPPAPDDDRVSPNPSTSAVAGRSGSPVPVPTVTDDAATVLSGVRDMPAETAPAGAATRSVADPAVVSAPEVKASVAVGEPRDGESITAATPVTGIADMPDGHEVWLLSRHGSGGYRVEGACRGGHSFTCGPATLESGGDADFELTALVVDPATARGLQAGETRDGLPAHLARSEVAVRRAAA